MGCPNNNCLHTQSLYPEGLPITKGVVVFEIVELEGVRTWDGKPYWGRGLALDIGAVIYAQEIITNSWMVIFLFTCIKSSFRVMSWLRKARRNHVQADNTKRFSYNPQRF